MNTPTQASTGSGVSPARLSKRRKVIMWIAICVVAIGVGWYGYTLYKQNEAQNSYDALNSRLDQFMPEKPVTDEQRDAIGDRLDAVEKTKPMSEEEINAINSRLDQLGL